MCIQSQNYLAVPCDFISVSSAKGTKKGAVMSPNLSFSCTRLHILHQGLHQKVFSHHQRLLTPAAARSGDQFWRVHQEQLPVIRSRNTAGPANKVTQCHSNKVTQRVLLTTFLCSVHLLTTFACISSPPPFWRKLELVALGLQ